MAKVDLNVTRQKYLEKISDALSEDEILITGTNEIAIPTLDEAGNEIFVVIKVTIPKGSRDGEAYDGYSMQEAYTMNQKTKAEKAEKAEADKKKKIARDKAAREEKARLDALKKLREA